MGPVAITAAGVTPMAPPIAVSGRLLLQSCQGDFRDVSANPLIPLYELPTIRNLVGCERAVGELHCASGDGLMTYSVNRAVYSRRGPVLLVVSGRAVRARDTKESVNQRRLMRPVHREFSGMNPA